MTAETRTLSCPRCDAALRAARAVRSGGDDGSVLTLEGLEPARAAALYGPLAETCPSCRRQIGLAAEGRSSRPVATVQVVRLEASPGALLPKVAGCIRCLRVRDVLVETARAYRPDGVHAPWAFDALLDAVVGAGACRDCGRRYARARHDRPASPAMGWEPNPATTDRHLPRLDCPMCDAFVRDSFDRGVTVSPTHVEIPWGVPELHYGKALTRAGFACDRCGRRVRVEEHPRGVSNVTLLDRAARHGIRPGPTGPLQTVAPAPLAPLAVPEALRRPALPESLAELLAALRRVLPGLDLDVPRRGLTFPSALPCRLDRPLTPDRLSLLQQGARDGWWVALHPTSATERHPTLRPADARYDLPEEGLALRMWRFNDDLHLPPVGPRERSDDGPELTVTLLLPTLGRALEFTASGWTVYDHRPPRQAFWVAARSQVLRHARVERSPDGQEAPTLEVRHLREALASPDDDRPRRALAAVWHAVGDPRGPLVELQLRAARCHRRGVPVPAALKAQIEDALAPLAARIAEPVKALVDGWEIRRGLVEHVTLRAADFPRRAAELYARAPIRHLTLTAAGDALDAIDSPHLARLHSLSLAGGGLDDLALARLARSPHLARLRWLDLAGNAITAEGLGALAAASTLPALRHVRLVGNPCGDPAAQPPCDGWGERTVPDLSPTGAWLARHFGPRPWYLNPAPDDRDFDPLSEVDEG